MTWGIETQKPHDAYSMGVRCDPHPYGTCACGKKSAFIIFHAEADFRNGARKVVCADCKDAALESVIAFYGGRK